jgi:hypothetical protein
MYLQKENVCGRKMVCHGHFQIANVHVLMKAMVFVPCTASMNSVPCTALIDGHGLCAVHSIQVMYISCAQHGCLLLSIQVNKSFTVLARVSNRQPLR